MAQTYTQIQRQIEALQKQAEKLRQSEVAGVVERIKQAIAHYSLTPDQLFGTSSAAARKVTSSAKAAGKSSRAKGSSSAAYADGAGNTWGGRGPRPHWLRDALAAGQSLEDFASNGGSKGKRKSGARADSKRKAQGYSDGSGNNWSGFGPKPRWLKDAIATGGTLEQFAIDRLTSETAE